MPVLDDPRHEKFAQLRAQQVCADKAYVQAGYKRNDSNAARLNGNERIKARVAELLLLSAGRCVLSIEEKRNFLARVVRAKPADADMDNPDCELVMTKMGPACVFPSKIAAIREDNDLAVDGAEAGKNRAIEIVIRKL